MAEKIYIHDDFGNKIPLVDNYGNLSVQVIMLYTEDKLTSADRKIVSDFAESDEMSKDALEGYAMTTNASKTRHQINELNASIQKQTGARPVSPLVAVKKETIDFRKIAAAIAFLIILGGGTFVVSQFLGTNELAQTIEPQVELKPDNDKNVQEKPVSTTLLSDSLNQLDSIEVLDAKEQRNSEVSNPEQRVQTEKENTVKKKDRSEPEMKSSKVEEDEIATSVIKDDDVVDVELTVASEEAEMELGSAPLQEQKASENYTRDKRLLLNDESAGVGSRQQRPSSSTQLDQLEAMSSDMDASDINTDNSSSARYPGGDIMMYQFLEKKKNYTEAMKAQGIKGNVTVSFNVETDGRVTGAKIKNGANGLLNEDALRIVRSMPKWNPATENGTPVLSEKSVIIKYGD